MTFNLNVEMASVFFINADLLKFHMRRQRGQIGFGFLLAVQFFILLPDDIMFIFSFKDRFPAPQPRRHKGRFFRLLKQMLELIFYFLFKIDSAPDSQQNINQQDKGRYQGDLVSFQPDPVGKKKFPKHNNQADYQDEGKSGIKCEKNIGRDVFSAVDRK